MTTRKIQKRAWRQIQQIRDASNMLDVHGAISEGVLEVFGLRHIGMLRVVMRNRGMLNDFYALQTWRLFEKAKHERFVIQYLATHIPERLHKCRMYQMMKAS